MDDSSPSKRRKPSPLPTTPSRIPVRREHTQPLSGRPSFASPTKSSIARHNPELLTQPSSAGSGAERPGSRGRDLQDVFARALGEVRPSIEGGDGRGTDSLGSTTQGSNDVSHVSASRPGPRRARSDSGGLSAQPRRMSQSPFKQAPKRFASVGLQREAVKRMQENIDPFRKTGLRRSSVGSQTGEMLRGVQDNVNPFEKRGLRRSPVLSQPVDTIKEDLGRTEVTPEPSITPTNLLPSKTAESPILSDPRTHEPNTATMRQQSVHAVEPIALNSLEWHKEPELLPDTTKQPWTPEVVKAVTLRNAELPQQDLPLNSQQQARTSQAVEVVTLNNPRRPEEPELPPTPTQRGLADPIVTTPPIGIHDTLSKRARKKIESINLSPLKSRDPPPAKVAENWVPESQSNLQMASAVKCRRSVRFLVPEDPHASKKAARDDLLKELQQILEDVALANQENERLHLHYDSRKQTASASFNPEKLLGMLLRSTAAEAASGPKPEVGSIFKSIESFLPFTSRRKRQHISLIAIEKHIPSHLPIGLNDPLPFLHAFSPLTYTSNITLLPSESASSESSQEAEQPILRRHLIKVSHPSGLFSARLSMIVDSSLLSITSLDIKTLPQSAEKELGTFMRERSNVGAVLNRDIGVVGWAMGRWVEVSILRARFWCAVEDEFGTPEARAKSLQRKRKRQKHEIVDDIDDLGHYGNYEANGTRRQNWTRRQLLPHMGRTAMELVNNDVELRFEWSIGFDWTGEVDSSISATSRLPKSWQKQDDRKSLKKIPEAFDKLVKERGPLSAVRTIVRLLMPAL